MASRRWLLLCVVLQACAAGSQTGPLPVVRVDQPPDQPGIEVGSDISLEAIGDSSCHLHRTVNETAATGELFEVRCAGWDAPTGYILRRPIPLPGPPGTADRLAEALADGRIPAEASSSLTCEPAIDKFRQDERRILYRRTCRARSGGFPEMVVAGSADGAGFVAWGPPHLAPSFDGFLAHVGDVQSLRVIARAGSNSAFIEAAEQAIRKNGRVLTLADYGQYARFVSLGHLLNMQGDFSRALEVDRAVLDLHDRLLGRDASSGAPMIEIGVQQSDLGFLDQAQQTFAGAEPLVQQSVDKQDYPRFLTYRAALARKRQDYARSQSDLRQAIDIYTRYRARWGVGYSSSALGDTLLAMNRNAEAATAFEQAWTNSVAAWGRSSEWAAISSQRWAVALRRLGRLAEARDHAQAAYDLGQALFGDAPRTARFGITLARIDAELGNRDRAATLFNTVMAQAARDPFGGDRLTADDIDPYLTFLYGGSRGAISGPAAATAFEAAQVVRDSVTAGALRAMAARVASGQPALAGTIRQLQDLRQSLGAVRRDLAKAESVQSRDPTQIAQLRADIATRSGQFDAIEAELQSRYPDYGRLLSQKKTDWRQLAALLRPSEALVQIIAGSDDLWIFLLRRDQVTFARSPLSPTEIGSLVRSIRAQVSEGVGTIPFDLSASARLYAATVGLLDDGMADVDHAIFVTSGDMASLPPQILIRRPSPPGSHDYAAADWLIRHMAVSVLPAASALQDLRGTAPRSSASRPFIGIGDPQFRRGGTEALAAAASACRAPYLADTSILFQLPELPETADELRAIAATLHAPASDLILGAQATKPVVARLPLDQYRIIEFATHALLPREIPCQNEPALVLTPPAQGTADDDGLLSASEVSRLRLNADWVLLSACNTAGPGGELSGDALSGLTRAFLYAGARAILASHWSVASIPTVKLTTGTLEKIAAKPGTSRAEALRQTELELLQTPLLAHPAFWAPFILVGDGGASPT